MAMRIQLMQIKKE